MGISKVQYRRAVLLVNRTLPTGLSRAYRNYQCTHLMYNGGGAEHTGGTVSWTEIDSSQTGPLEASVQCQALWCADSCWPCAARDQRIAARRERIRKRWQALHDGTEAPGATITRLLFSCHGPAASRGAPRRCAAGGAAPGDAKPGQLQLAQQLEQSRQRLLRLREDAEQEASALSLAGVRREDERRTLIEGQKQARPLPGPLWVLTTVPQQQRQRSATWGTMHRRWWKRCAGNPRTARAQLQR